MPKDPFCGSEVTEEDGVIFEHNDQTYYFCCDFCKEIFQDDPEKFIKRGE